MTIATVSFVSVRLPITVPRLSGDIHETTEQRSIVVYRVQGDGDRLQTVMALCRWGTHPTQTCAVAAVVKVKTRNRLMMVMVDTVMPLTVCAACGVSFHLSHQQAHIRRENIWTILGSFTIWSNAHLSFKNTPRFDSRNQRIKLFPTTY